MSSMREKIEDVFAAVAFAERNDEKDAIYLAKASEAVTVKKAEKRVDSRPRAAKRAE